MNYFLACFTLAYNVYVSQEVALQLNYIRLAFVSANGTVFIIQGRATHLISHKIIQMKVLLDFIYIV